MDLCLYGKNNGVPPIEVAPSVGLTPEQVEWVYADIDKMVRESDETNNAKTSRYPEDKEYSYFNSGQTGG